MVLTDEEREERRRAAIAARTEPPFTNTSLERGSTDGYGASFAQINAALRPAKRAQIEWWDDPEVDTPGAVDRENVLRTVTRITWQRDTDVRIKGEMPLVALVRAQ